MEITKIFTKKNIEILNLLEKESLHIREIAERLKISPAKVHQTIQIFKKHNIINEIQDKNRKIIKLNKNNNLLKNIENLMETKQPEEKEETIPLFENISPLDYRYYGRDEKTKQKLKPYLSEEGAVRYLARVEAALTRTLAKKGICSKSVANEVQAASTQVTAQEVYKEEDRIKHNIRALANSIRNRVSDKAKPYVHFTTTSHDIICTADAARFKEFSNDTLIPAITNLERTLIHLALREKNTLQIGRTHGQHAEPITFGFAIAQYVSRLGTRIKAIQRTANNLRGKIAGAVGAYNASSLFFEDPESFEADVLKELKLKPSPISTQVVEAEYMADFIHSVTSCFGVLANLADDMRHLQRSEIGEVGEFFEAKQVGSSTMPHKRNPINFENVKSMWKEFMPRMNTLYMDQICEHQRDLTNSATSRFIPEILAGLYTSINRLNRTMSKLVVDKNNLKKNFDMNKEMITAEPVYILLAAHNHPDAHEYTRELTLKSQQTGKPFRELLFKDKSIEPYLAKFTKKQIEILKSPENYLGISSKKVEKLCSFWKKELKID
ncbi:MAG: ArsR family transcriptional regulator [Nanoarchaeota archaeon]|nr:ArsR family transcriptional regulator [Nanoarchaeota archaeon]MBU1005202.1 ArsR family transcriptional regulator [Nanoarchaeota archaeon]MBU1946873.1 ArsR family transcriptional regulator [Nanoarchaeota archaeon]